MLRQGIKEVSVITIEYERSTMDFYVITDASKLPTALTFKRKFVQKFSIQIILLLLLIIKIE